MVLDAPFVDCSDFRLQVSQFIQLEVLLHNINVVLHLLDGDVMQKHSAIVDHFNFRLQVFQIVRLVV